MRTPAWDVNFRITVSETPALQNLKVSEMVDLFACWFLLGEPRIRPGSIGNNMTFGFRETFNGVGIFVFKESSEYKLIAVENLGNEQTTLAKLGKAFKAGVNGCVVDATTLVKEVALHLRMEQGMLTVTYGPKMRQSTHKVCVEKLYLPNLSNRGFLGITARNSDRYVKDIEVHAVKVANLDPNFYRHIEENAQAEDDSVVADRTQTGAVYTDEMKGVDVID